MHTSRRPAITVLCPSDGDKPVGMEIIEADAEVTYTDAAGLADALVGAEALLLWDFFSDAVHDAWPSSGSLRWIHVAAAGVDKLLFPELVDADVVVTNARGIFDRAMAEFVLGSILAVAKDLHASHDLQAARTWHRRETRLVSAETALVVGTGSIGRETARLLRAVGMDVRGAGRTARSDDPDFGDIVASADLEAHVGWADHVIVAAPLTPDTRGLISKDVLAAMKPGSHLVNVGRGPIVDETALIAALRDGPVAAASLDVFEVEPLPTESPLWAMPGVAVSAHMSGDYEGWREALAVQFVDNARRWLAGEPLLNVVDKRHGFVVTDEGSRR
ncbi:phosphoglycerate dehydrogenase-like enzyme [Nocardioides luteus]|uniref:2-hydroxyacid dehydrogenase n=2 Tax=Nocardioides luteus TaxID=1844 RepID=A0ABQ5T356_9ACTN|nr:D-2-hydroxyacid dehydrogenase [Nocardioides luteus]MDR7310212.1 phosphoglycerate dehydrogenase-like enzyme [Nocardioides luteus]GGR69593.1 2-hydroxyacid dehydrogenase [Nocardioides luteus]GLJ70320.1 2-hydroxyacid dehydrogenase [Nocardioides luteus]